MDVQENKIPKKIQKIFEERDIWPLKRLKLIHSRLECFNCQITTEYKIRVKEYKYGICKNAKECNLLNCSKN